MLLPSTLLRRLAGLAFAAAALAGCAFADGLEKGAVAPELAVDAWVNTGPAGTPSVAASRGKHLLVEFWSMHCPHCRDEIPQMRELTARWCCTDLDVLSVHVPLGDHDDTAQQVAAFAQQASLPFPVGVDRAGRTLADYECGYLPHGVLIGPDGRVVWAGSLTIYDVEDRIREALGAAGSGTVAAARTVLSVTPDAGTVPAGLALRHAPRCADGAQCGAPPR